MKKTPTFAYVQHLRIPNEFAIGLYIVKVCEAAQKLGYATHLVIPKRTQPDYFPKQDIWQYYKVEKNVFEVASLWVPELLRLPKIVEIFYKRLRNLCCVWIFSIQALWLLYKKQINIIETIDREIICLLRVCWWYKPQVIYDVHDEVETGYEKLLDRFLVPRVDLFMVNCGYFREYYGKRKTKKQKIITLANGFDPKHYQFKKSQQELRKQFNLPRERFIVGFIGRFDTFGIEKGVREMLQAAASLKKKLPITMLAIGGPEKLAQQYRELAIELGLAKDEAVVLSQVDPELVANYIQTFDIACMLYPDVPHYRWKMSPMKAIEYMAANKPIIATDLPSIRELLDETSGYLIQPIDVQELTKVIEDIYKHLEESKKKAQKAYDFVQRYTWENRQSLILNSLGK